MAWVREQKSTVATGNDVTAIAPSWPAATTAGHLLVAVVTISQSIGDATVTAPGAPDWTLAVDSDANTPGPRTLIYYIENAGSRSGAESFSISAARDAIAWLIEYSGAATASVLDVVQSAKSAAAATPVSSGTTAAIADTASLAIAVLTNRQQTDTQGAPANSFTSVETAATSNATNTRTIRSQLCEKIGALTAAGDGTSATLSSARPNAGCVAVFKPAGGAPPADVLPTRPLVVGQAGVRASRW